MWLIFHWSSLKSLTTQFQVTLIFELNQDFFSQSQGMALKKSSRVVLICRKNFLSKAVIFDGSRCCKWPWISRTLAARIVVRVGLANGFLVGFKAYCIILYNTIPIQYYTVDIIGLYKCVQSHWLAEEYSPVL